MNDIKTKYKNKKVLSYKIINKTMYITIKGGK